MIFKSNSNKWLILFAGKNREKVISNLIENNIEVIGIGFPSKRKDIGKILQNMFNGNSIPIIELNKKDILSKLSAFSKCNLLSIGFPYKLPNELIERFEICLNLHPTLLPKYGGMNSGAYLIQNNEKQTGSTVHLLTNELDQGPILMQSYIPLSKFDTTRSMQYKVYAKEPGLVLDSIHALEKGAEFLPQNKMNGSYYEKRTPNDSQFDPNHKFIDLYDFIRSCDPIDYPAFFELEGQRVFVKMWTENRQKENPYEI